MCLQSAAQCFSNFYEYCSNLGSSKLYHAASIKLKALLAACNRYSIVNSRWTEDIDVDRVQQVKERFLELPGVLSIQDFLSGWFHGAPFESIRRGNVLDFVAYGFYSQNFADLTPRVCLTSLSATPSSGWMHQLCCDLVNTLTSPCNLSWQGRIFWLQHKAWLWLLLLNPFVHVCVHFSSYLCN